MAMFLIPAERGLRDATCSPLQQKQVVEFGEWLYMEVVKKVPHRQFVFSLPKSFRLN